MTIQEFISTIQQHPEFQGTSVCKMQMKDSPVFFSNFAARLKELNNSTATIDAEVVSLGDIKAQLEMSFLGQRLIYCIKNCSDFDAATKKAWQTYLKNYDGPHCVIYTSAPARVYKGKVATTESEGEKAENDSAMIVQIPESVDSTLYQALCKFFYPDLAFDSFFLSKLFNEIEQIPLDDACLMMVYQSVVGRKCEPFFAQWFSRIVPQQHSFFTLSQYLFSRQPKQFLEQWKKCKGDFPEEFWVSYWSEQIWQASLFVYQARLSGYAEAKKGTYRLPFSFLNKDWQRYSFESLVDAHQQLYQFDFNMKNGGTGHGLELWYHRFLKA